MRILLVSHPELFWSDENAGLIQAIVLHIDEAYFQCLRSVQFADLRRFPAFRPHPKFE